MSDVMLSLATNPHNPFDDYAKWSQFDRHEGFDTAGLLARALSTSDALSEPMQEVVLEQTIDGILANPSFEGLYVKVTRE